ncbi:hypothetical protein ACFY4C_25410 [Actinomadura viridis]|uniref:hypothetical protein n=1 Tax=Actinomadura viridis TaxID=58110 RepID=UPI003681BEAE
MSDRHERDRGRRRGSVFDTGRPWPRRHPRATALLTVLAVLIVAAAGWGAIRLSGPDECADGVRRVTVEFYGEKREECVGVTATYAFDSRYKRLMQRIEEENTFAEKDTHVTVAYLGPLTHPDPRVLHRLEGAVAGQHRANRENLVGDRPRIRLVLANTGSDSGHWREVSETLAGMVGGTDRLVGVAGVGLSQRQTLEAARRLSQAELPMVGDIVTADVLNKSKADGLARVNPRVDEEIAVLARHVRERTKFRKATLVSHSDPDDYYTAALAGSFKTHMRDLWKAGGSAEYPFGKNPGNEFSVIAGNLCSTDRPDMVFYAGRALDLPKFIGYLSTSTCGHDPITIVTGSDAVLLTVDGAENKKALAALASTQRPLTLLYTPLAEPSLLEDERHNRDADRFRAFQAAYKRMGFDPEHLRTGWGIMAHDAMLTVTRAIRLAAGPGGSVPRPLNARSALYLINTPSSAVPGASGTIRLDPATGDRVGLRLPVLRLRPDRGVDFLGMYPSPARTG